MRPLLFCVALLLIVGCEQLGRRAGEARESPPAASAAAPQSASLTTVQRFELKKTCMEQGQRRWKEESQRFPRGTSAAEPTYCYSQTLNTCLYFFGAVYPKATELGVVDLVSNESVASHISGANGRIIGLAAEEFSKKRDELLATCLN
jgi:hypothetical protein